MQCQLMLNVLLIFISFKMQYESSFLNKDRLCTLTSATENFSALWSGHRSQPASIAISTTFSFKTKENQRWKMWLQLNRISDTPSRYLDYFGLQNPFRMAVRIRSKYVPAVWQYRWKVNGFCLKTVCNIILPITILIFKI